jgi:hypothetical protein
MVPKVVVFLFFLFSLIGLHMLYTFCVYIISYKINRIFIFICVYIDPFIFCVDGGGVVQLKLRISVQLCEKLSQWRTRTNVCVWVCACIFQPVPLASVPFRACIPIHSTNVLAQLFIKNCEKAAEKIKESGQKSLRANLYGSFIALILQSRITPSHLPFPYIVHMLTIYIYMVNKLLITIFFLKNYHDTTRRQNESRIIRK